MVGPLSLKESCIRFLSKLTHFLGDVGGVPIQLLKPIFVECSPEDLLRIEKETMEGSWRDLLVDTWPLWSRHVQCAVQKVKQQHPSEWKNRLQDLKAPPLKDPHSKHSSFKEYLKEPGAKPIDYRLVWERLQQAEKERMMATGKKLKDMWREEREKKLSRSTKVIDPLHLVKMKERDRLKKIRKPVAQPQHHTSLSRKLGIQPPPVAVKASSFKRQQQSMIRKARSSNDPYRHLPKASQLRKKTNIS